MSVAGYNTVIRKTGTATTMTGQAMSTYSSVAKTYRINSTARRIWDRNTALVFKAGVVDITTDATPNRLFGTVVFGTTHAGAYTVAGKYLPATVIAGAHTYTLTQSRELLDDTDFSSTGWRSRTGGLLDASLTASRWVSLADFDDHYTALTAGSPIVAEVRPGGSTTVGRGYFLIEAENFSGDVSGLESADLSLLHDDSTAASFSWGPL